MRRYTVLALLVGLCLSSVGWAEINRQIWDTGSVTESLVGVREFFADKRPDMMPFSPAPDIDDVLAESTWGDRADQYYGHLWGWVTIPESGSYTWYIHGDNHSVLHVSTDENWENVEEVAWVDGWSNIEEWDSPANGGADTASDPMEYAAGQTLAVWAIMVEGSGGDNLGIGWTRPGSTTIEYISEYVTNIAPQPTKARNPLPEPGAVDVPRDVDMSWTAGRYAATHDVYLGTSAEDVNAASRGNPMDVLVSQGQTGTDYDPGILEFGQTYYWRIDEVNAAPDNTIYKGPIWEFTVEPFTYPVEGIVATSSATSDEGSGIENIVNGSGLNAAGEHSVEPTDMWLASLGNALPIVIDFELPQVYKLDEMRIWNYNVMFELLLGFGAKDATVEYSADGVEWTVLGDVELAQATAMASYTANTILDFGGVPVKYVRLSINSGWGPLGQYGLSEIQFMYVPAHAREPQPADGGTDIGVGTALAWRAGREAVTHDVHFGTDPNALALAGTADTASFTPSGLEFGMDFYWRVDEVNEADEVTTWPGNTWTFRTQDYALIDGFESYDNEDNPIYEAWLDGWVNDTGSTAGYLTEPFAETSVVNSGAQSLPLQYDNSLAPFYSEVEKELGPMSLSAGGADQLRLFVAGLAPAFAEAADGTILMNAIGTDIWDTGDEFRFVYKNLTGDGSMVARVDALDNTPSTWAKAGVMIRQGTGTGSQHSFMCMTGGDGNGASWQGRLEQGLTSENVDATDPVALPYWVRIDRAGNMLTGFVSPDGQNWTQIGDPREVVMNNPVLIGLALTSHLAGQATSAQFSNVSFTGNVTGNWQNAAIGATQPEGNDPAPVYLAVEDTSGNVAVVTCPADPPVSAWSEWYEWIIPYSDLGGVSLNSVQTLYIGLGDRDNPASGGAGILYVDDIGYGRPYVGSSDEATP